MNVTDTVSVMRQGEMTATVQTADTNAEKLAELMVGRKVLLQINKDVAKIGPLALSCKKLNYTDEKGVKRLKNISFHVNQGEILGIAGVAGNGQSELLEVLAGIKKAEGEITVNSKRVPLNSKNSNPLTRRHLGISHVPEDRQKLGLVMDFYAWENMALGYHHKHQYGSSGIFINNSILKLETEERIKKFDIRPNNSDLLAKSFSGGNQQKIVLAREIEQNPNILIVGQPTRGVDIGAIEFIHKRIIQLRDAGKAVILISVELDEILSLSDRILVMFDGKIMGEKTTSHTNEKELGLLMAGIG